MSKYLIIDLETAIVDKLREAFLQEFPGALVESMQSDVEKAYATIGNDGSVLVRFDAKRPERDERLMQTNIPAHLQPKHRIRSSIIFVVFVAVNSVANTNPHHLALMYLQTAEDALMGYTILTDKKQQVTLRPGDIDVIGPDTNYNWWYGMPVETNLF